MNPLSRLVPRAALRRLAASGSLPRLCLLAVVGAGMSCAATSCSTNDLARVESAAKTVYQDATSPAGRQLLADVTSTALNLGLDLASGNDAGAAVAGIQGAASAVRDYEGLPSAPSASTIAKAAAAGAGVVSVSSTIAPSVETLIEGAQKTATQQKINVSVDDITEALARGFDAVAGAKAP